MGLPQGFLGRCLLSGETCYPELEKDKGSPPDRMWGKGEGQIESGPC